MTTHLTYITDTLAKSHLRLQPIDKQSYDDWTKVYDFISELHFALEPNAQVYPYVGKLAQVWVKLGDAFGYFVQLQKHRGRNMCSYARCTGHSVRGMEQLTCGDCLSEPYCSSWCQRA